MSGPLRIEIEEERRSAAMVGVREVEFLGHRDGIVEYGLPSRRDLASAFRRLRPEVIITLSFDLAWGDDGPVSHFVDVTATIDSGIASLREHRAYLDGLGRDFDPDEFLRTMAVSTGQRAGCKHAVGFRGYPMG